MKGGMAMADMLKKIPGGITPEDFMTLRGFLKDILNAVGVRQVIMRLNRTGEELPCPLFIGWVQHPEIESSRTAGNRNEPDPGLFRFADNNYSPLYNQTLSAAQTNSLVEKVWDRSDAPYAEKSDHAKALGPEAGVTYQRYIGIKAGGRCVGSLSVGLSGAPDPTTRQQIDQSLVYWATESASPLVSYLQENFVLGGPVV
jgi:hypothetical protein